MCGICGIYNFHGEPVLTDCLQRMNQSLSHRGPDEEGIYQENNIGLGVRRLRVIDLAGGKQPVKNEDGQIILIFNGEIYNFKELSEFLIRRGHNLKSQSDTEVIVHLYEEYGTHCLDYLRGMFALALWDKSLQRLFLARDRIGKKPLSYFTNAQNFVFASEIKALREHPAFPRELSLSSLNYYLVLQYIPNPYSIYQKVTKLPPAHYLLTDTRGNVRLERYWELKYLPKLNKRREDYPLELKENLREAVRLRLNADVPLGIFLSGGMDSSTIVALAREVTSGELRTFSVGFPENDWSELKYARLVAQRFSTRHEEIIVKPRLDEVLPKLVYFYDEPFADPSAVPTYYLAQATRNYVTVALSGDGGDENFAGYDRYWAVSLGDTYHSLLPAAMRFLLSKLVNLSPVSERRFSLINQARRFLNATEESWPERNFRLLSIFTPPELNELYTSSLWSQISEENPYQNHEENLSVNRDLDRLDQLLALDVSTYLPFCLMVKMDIASMANSLEVRSPFLDYRVMEFVAQLPPAYKRQGKEGKYLLKQTFAPDLPPTVCQRRKMGFGLPLNRWFRSQLRTYISDILLDPQAFLYQYFQPAGVRALLEAHWRGRQDNSRRIWTLLFLELWQRGQKR